MEDKIALVSCSGLSPLGLIVRVATIDLALENENIVLGCLSESTAQPNVCSPIYEDCPIVSITGCKDDCVSNILKERNLEIVKNIDAESLMIENNVNFTDSARLDDEGERGVEILKNHILEVISNL